MSGVLPTLLFDEKPIIEYAAGKNLFWPAGFSQFSRVDQSNRQNLYKEIYCLSSSMMYPLGKTGHEIILSHDPSNKYDSSAVTLTLRADKDSPLGHLNGRDLGFFPALRGANKDLIKVLPRIRGARIFRATSLHLDKFYLAQMALSFDEALEFV